MDIQNGATMKVSLMIVDGESPDDSYVGIGMINGLDYRAIEDMRRDLLESMEAYVVDAEVPEGAVMANFEASNFSYEEGQQTFPETCQWDFPPHWEMDLKFEGFDIGCTTADDNEDLVF